MEKFPTPRLILFDIAAASAIRTRAVMAATGVDAYETLLAEKPFALFRNFANTIQVLEAFKGNPFFDHPSTNGSVRLASDAR